MALEAGNVNCSNRRTRCRYRSIIKILIWPSVDVFNGCVVVHVAPCVVRTIYNSPLLISAALEQQQSLSTAAGLAAGL